MQIPKPGISHATRNLVELAVQRFLAGSCLVRLTRAIRLQSRRMGECGKMSLQSFAAEAVHLLVGLNRRILRKYLNCARYVTRFVLRLETGLGTESRWNVLAALRIHRRQMI